MKQRNIWLGTAAVVALLAAFFFALPEPAPPAALRAPGFAVRDVRVFDGEQFLERATVIVQDGRIARLGADLPVPAGMAVVDGRGKTLLPGLIDAHVHTYGSALHDALNFGVTTVLDMFTDPATLRELKPSRDSIAPREHADIFSAGWLATVPRGHGTEYPLSVPTLTEPSQADAWVTARIAEGSDYIKIVYEPPGPHGLGPPFPSLDRPTMTALVQAAHTHHKLAVVHISRLQPAREAVEAGIDGLVHVFADRDADASFIEQIRRHGTFVIPTLAVNATLAGGPLGRELAKEPDIAPFLSPDQRPMLDMALSERIRIFRLEFAMKATRQLFDAGVPILAGTDAPNPGTAHGASLHQELELLVRAGLPPIAALQAATATPARCFGLQDRGRIAPGMRADLLLIAGDPRQDIRLTRRIERIWKNGASIERQRYPLTP